MAKRKQVKAFFSYDIKGGAKQLKSKSEVIKNLIALTVYKQ